MGSFTLSAEQVNAFGGDGYLIVERLFDSEEMDLLRGIAKGGAEMESLHEPRDGEGGITRLLISNELHDDIYSAVARSERIVDAMETLLGDEVYHFHHKMAAKEPRVGGAWAWHQDFGYWYHNSSCLFPDMGSCMVAVDRATRENGCLQVLKGSHRCGRIEHGLTGDQSGADMQRVEALLERLPRVYVELEAGDGLFFHSNTLHRSDQNRSDEPRWALICCYNTKHNSPYKMVPNSHPAYKPLDKLPDAMVRQIGRRQLEQIHAGR